MVDPTRCRNLLLGNLESEAIERLQLAPVYLEVDEELEAPGRKSKHVVFLESGVASTTVVFESGKQVEAYVTGCESLIGLSRVMGVDKVFHRTYMQVAGRGLRASLEVAREEFLRHQRFRDQVIRCEQLRLLEMMQVVACNAVHTQKQRLARWFLQCYDRAGDLELTLSQLQLADMLGSRRSSVSLAASEFQKSSILEQRRGSVRILNLQALEAEACECVFAMRETWRILGDFGSR